MPGTGGGCEAGELLAWPWPGEPAPAKQGGERGLALAGDADPAGVLAHLPLLHQDME